VRRFCLHILPERFVKIRHYGLLGNRKRQQRLANARQLLGVPEPPKQQETSAGKGNGHRAAARGVPFASSRAWFTNRPFPSRSSRRDTPSGQCVGA